MPYIAQNAYINETNLTLSCLRYVNLCIDKPRLIIGRLAPNSIKMLVLAND